MASLARQEAIVDFRVVERRSKVASLFAMGLTQVDIASALDVSPSTVGKDLRALKDEWRESAAADIEVAMWQDYTRLESMFQAIYKRAVVNGDLDAIDRALKILESKSKLLGYDVAQELAKQRLAGSDPITIIEVVKSDQDRQAQPFNDPAKHAKLIDLAPDDDDGEE